MKVVVISDIHGSGYYADKIKEIDEREKYKRFYAEYEKAETSREKEILFLKREISILDSNEENKEIIQFYKNRLISYGVMKSLKNNCRTSNKFTKTNRKAN